MKTIRRNDYMDQIMAVIGTSDIKVITGVRRSGKSKLLESFKDELSSQIADANIIHINFNLLEYEQLNEYHALYNYINDHYLASKTNFVLIDEIQMCEGFEKAINALHASEKFDLYVTGSNAFMLSSDLATLFTGRTYEIKVFPFSFAEYTHYFGIAEGDIYNAFSDYLLEGGMAGSYPYSTPEAKYNYLKEIFNTLIVRDIQNKYGIRNMATMNSMIDFMMDNVANLSSARGITNSINAGPSKVDHKTIGNYLSHLCNAFIFYKISRYDIRGKKYLSTTEKYYLCDHSFRYAMLGTKNMNHGRTIENIVAIELLRRGYEVYVGVLYEKEIDFVAIKRNEKLYIQVSDNISDEKTFNREVSPLLQIKDAYPKILIARTQEDTYIYEGVQVIDVARWLLA